MCSAHFSSVFLRSGSLVPLSTTCFYVKELGIFLRNSTCFPVFLRINSINFLTIPISDPCEIGWVSFKSYLDKLKASKGLKGDIRAS